MPEEKMNGDKKDIEENKAVAAIGYIWILFIVPLFLKKDSKFCKFHGKQALVLFIVETAGIIVYWIPFLGWIVALLFFVLAVLAIVQAFQGNYWEIPVIGSLAKKFNI